MDNNFKLEEKEILNCYFESDLFKTEKTFSFLDDSDHSPGILLKNMGVIQGIELIVRPQCNQKCEYCYVTRYGRELYPVEERLTNDQILRNIDSILTYVFETKDCYENHWELFAGDLFYDDLVFDILDVFYNHISKLYQIHRRIMSIPENEGLILIPTNFSFIDDDKKTQRTEEYIQKFKKLNWELGFSISTDGPSCVETREQRELNSDHFDKLFQWTLKYPRNGFHAIISASNVKNAIESYKWWKEQFEKYYANCDNEYFGILPYWLEARNDEWTSEAIEDYLKLLDYMWEDRLKMCDNDIDKLAYHLFVGDGKNNTPKQIANNDLINLKMELDTNARQITQCSLMHVFCINVSTLDFVPCHRLTYKQFAGGAFIQDENAKIIDFEPKNVSGYLTTVLHSGTARPKCAACIYNLLCHRGCLGAQYEACGELFQPAISVCQLSETYIKHLIDKYHTSGLLKSARRQNILLPEYDIIFGEILIHQLGYSPEEVYHG